MTLRVRRHETGTSFKRCTWWPLWLTDGRLTATVICNNYHLGTLEDHAIAADGTVTPSLECPDDGCAFHENVQLVGWDPNLAR